MGIRLGSRVNVSKTLLGTFVMLMVAAVISGCQAKPEANEKSVAEQSKNESVAVAESASVAGGMAQVVAAESSSLPAESQGKGSQVHGAQVNSNQEQADLPSMSLYTLERQSQQHTSGSAPGRETGELVKGSEGAVALAPGRYCFHKVSAENWLSIRLEVSENQRLNGESIGTVTHPQIGKAIYQQFFAGELVDTQALVEVTTYIADVSQSRQESWKIDTTQLDMGRVSIDPASCVAVSVNF